jgi:hypothetical protein
MLARKPSRQLEMLGGGTKGGKNVSGNGRDKDEYMERQAEATTRVLSAIHART